MRILVALGGNALLCRGEPMTAEAQRANVRIASQSLATICPGNEVIVTHGNGPQVGLLSLQGHAYDPSSLFPLDVLGAETEGLIGYMIEQELGNLLPFEVPFATVLTMTEVDRGDPAFKNPTKFIGPVYSKQEADDLEKEKGWIFRQDGNKWRRVVPSPKPKRIFEIRPIEWLLEKGAIVVAAGGGGIPTAYGDDGKLAGVEAVIDKDLCSDLLARELDVDMFVMATDADAVFLDWGTPEARSIRRASPDAMAAHAFPAGSMGPKVEAACNFARLTGKPAVIGALKDLPALVRGEAGTTITSAEVGETLYEPEFA
ncbi:carbamate kinase [Breoghania sp. JC706]|uniref:carbamate kinase n=1 Tax=Breoghania sp. JC706 TaxID=3117732 RepID=UPI00300B9195